MKYLKKFNQENDYSSFKNSENWITPNICAIIETQKTKLNKFVPPPPPPAMYGDIVFWDGSKVDYVNKTKWNADLGTPLGVVVVPEGFAPDGKTRFIALNAVDSSGNASTGAATMAWGDTSTDTSLTNFNRVTTTDNSGSTSTGSYSEGYLPSDKFTGRQSLIDAKAKYNETSNLIPSPYLTVDDKDILNPEYNKEISGYNNALNDFNGLSNTEVLSKLLFDYIASYATWKYSDGLSDVQYYLPAIGELGYLMARFNDINESLSLIGGVPVGGGGVLWSSTEYNSYNAYYLNPNFGYIRAGSKTQKYYIRAFGSF